MIQKILLLSSFVSFFLKTISLENSLEAIFCKLPLNYKNCYDSKAELPLYIVNYSRLFILIGFKSTLNTTYPLFSMEKYNILVCSRFQFRLKFEIELAEICHWYSVQLTKLLDIYCSIRYYNPPDKISNPIPFESFPNEIHHPRIRSLKAELFSRKVIDLDFL